MKTSLNGEGNSHPSPRNPESPKQDKPKATHPKTHINQINKDHIQRTNIKRSKGKKKKKQITYKGIPIRISVDLSIETLQAKREWQDIPKERKKKTYNLQPTKKTYNPDYCTQEVLIQIQRRNQKLYRQAKAEKIQYHQTSS